MLVNQNQVYQKRLNERMRQDPIVFADEMLGILLHPGQRKWVRNATKIINILRPGNKFGKTMTEAALHIWQAITKPQIAGRAWSPEEWLRIQYQTLVFGPTYEQARELLGMIVEMVQGNMLIYVCPHCDSHRIMKKTAKDKEFHCLMCDKWFEKAASRTNKSVLKDWAIKNDRSGSQLLPYISWFNGSQTLGRSYDEMGKAFKMKALAFITGDECGDVDQLYTFTTNTLLPRLSTMNGIIHFVGTPQAGGLDYNRMIELAEEDMSRKDWAKNGEYYTQRGSIYENIFVDPEYIGRIERVADPDLRRQIIEGEIVEVGDKFFGFERIKNMIDPSIQLLDRGLEGRQYLTAVDFAFGESAWADYTVLGVFDFTDEPWKLVHYERFKAKDIPVPLQYERVKEVVMLFHSRLIIDSSGPGGKNAAAFLRGMHPILFEFGPTGPKSSKKAEGLTSLKSAMDGGESKFQRKIKVLPDGTQVDEVVPWGLVRIPDVPEIVYELVNYKLDDKKIRTDIVMMIMMAVDWLMMRRPKQAKNRAVDIDMLGAMVSNQRWGAGIFPWQRNTRARDVG